MLNPEFVQENDMHKILWDFERQTDHLISARQPDLMRIYKKAKQKKNNIRKQNSKPAQTVLTDHWVKLKESEKKD